jgi:hypothetical protein
MPVQKAQNPNTTPSQKIIPTVSLRVEVRNEFCVVVEIYWNLTEARAPRVGAELWRNEGGVGGVEYVRAINKTKKPQIKNSTWWRDDIHLSIIALLAVRVSRHSRTLRAKNSTLPIKITNLQSEQLRVFVDLSDMLNPAMVSVCL